MILSECCYGQLPKWCGSVERKHPNIMTHKLCWAWRLLGDQRGFVIWHQWMRGEETWLYLMLNYSASHCFGVTPQKAKNDATPAWGTPFGGSVTPLKWSDTTPLDVIFCSLKELATLLLAIDFANHLSLRGPKMRFKQHFKKMSYCYTFIFFAGFTAFKPC